MLVFGEIRSGRIHPTTCELTGKARELADARGVEVSVLLIRGADAGRLCPDGAVPSVGAAVGATGENPLGPDGSGPGGESGPESKPGTMIRPEDLLRYGADRVVLVDDPACDPRDPEVAAKVLAEWVRSDAPEIVLAPATTTGRTVLPGAAARLGTGLTADCTGLEIEAETGLLLQTRPAIGGNIMATIKTPSRRPQMATVRPKTFRVPEPSDRPGRIVRFEPSPEARLGRTEFLSLDAAPGDDGDIQDREAIVSGGKGLRRPEGFALIRELAELLDAGVGGSRPTVEAKWISYPHQVGLSGKVVSPKLYLAAGISGSVQHLAGMQTAGKIVAVNRDPEAPIFRVADIALQGDLYEILPRLIGKVRAEGGGIRGDGR